MNVQLSQGDMPRLLEMHYGEKVQGTFTPAEIERRIKGLREILADLNMDAARA